MCQQMIMGGGKTTVVGPLLALLLADGKKLVTQVVPLALLEFSRGVMREKFCAVVCKPVYTFVFTRKTEVSPALYHKLVKARDTRAVVCSHPTAIKSFVLKFIEMMHLLDESRHVRNDQQQNRSWLRKRLSVFGLMKYKRRTLDASQLEILRQESKRHVDIFNLFQKGALLLDEVDLILHPLKSELNWPLGQKEPLDFTQSSQGDGLRWQIPFHLLDALFYARTGEMAVDFTDSREAMLVLEQIKTVIETGCKERVLQGTPHYVLLSKKFYDQHMRELLGRWLLIWLQSKRLRGVEDRLVLDYLMKGRNASAPSLDAIKGAFSDEQMKILNLSHDWLRSFLPFILGKIDRVSFGLLTPDDLVRALQLDAKMPRSRKLLAIPFMGKDVPTRASEFSHPDVVIGLTILAYRYEGLRRTDFLHVLTTLYDQMCNEYGPYHKRPACQTFVKWVTLAGGRVRGTKKRGEGADANGSADTEVVISAESHNDELRLKSPDKNAAATAAAGVRENALPPSPVGGNQQADANANANVNANANANASDSQALDEDDHVERGEFDDIWALQLLDLRDDDQVGVAR